ncbi:unnamed protein product [Periconia digitata]|uniref:Uncharacterized protein n=1 Tax=Periconia digitata TaxID=1303443 RepID=A0A9W4UAH1_9PLEO|nr:unnamed protein product [Periconia digitata]
MWRPGNAYGITPVKRRLRIVHAVETNRVSPVWSIVRGIFFFGVDFDVLLLLFLTPFITVSEKSSVRTSSQFYLGAKEAKEEGMIHRRHSLGIITMTGTPLRRERHLVRVSKTLQLTVQEHKHTHPNDQDPRNQPPGFACHPGHLQFLSHLPCESASLPPTFRPDSLTVRHNYEQLPVCSSTRP